MEGFGGNRIFLETTKYSWRQQSTTASNKELLEATEILGGNRELLGSTKISCKENIFLEATESSSRCSSKGNILLLKATEIPRQNKDSCRQKISLTSSSVLLEPKEFLWRQQSRVRWNSTLHSNRRLLEVTEYFGSATEYSSAATKLSKRQQCPPRSNSVLLEATKY